MFRPYSLTSITAWTVGRLAGNYAYYEVKQRNRMPKLTGASCPPGVRAMIQKLKAIEREATSLIAGLSKVRKNSTQTNVTPIIQAFAYESWLLSAKPRILAEIESAYRISMASGYVWPPTVVQDAQAGLGSLLESFAKIIGEIRTGFEQFLSTVPDPSMQQKVREIMNVRQRLCQVDENTCKLVDANDGDFILQ